mgnify:CR=1 FL=1
MRRKDNNPFYRYTHEERKKMSWDEYCALIEERNEFIRKKYSQINEDVAPKFNTIEELRAYYNCIPFDEAVNNMNKLFEN